MEKNIVDNAKIMLSIAQADFMFSPDEDQRPRFVQAFLLQASIMEGLIREFASDLNRKNKISGVKRAKNLYQACRETRVVGGISKEDFDKLLAYIYFRNDLIHRLLEKDDLRSLEKEINQKYVEGSDIISILI